MPAPLITMQSTAELPESADIVVIGGGIIGACAAYFLARDGLKVALLEKGRIGAEQSSRNWGWCRSINFRAGLRKHPILRLHRSITTAGTGASRLP